VTGAKVQLAASPLFTQREMMLCRKKKILLLVMPYLLLNLEACMNVQYHFPINTNYPYPGMGEADTRIKTPSYNNYNAQITDDTVPEKEQVIAFLKHAEKATGMKVIMLNDLADLQGPPLQKNSPSDQTAQNASIQIVNNVIIGEALFTVAFPPGWDPAGRYPMVLSGNGSGSSNNMRLFGEHNSDIGIAYYAGMSVREGGSGLIVAVCNCGGRESQGANSGTLQAIGDFIDLMADFYGGDRYQLVTFGSSRGGGTALLWGANPLNLDYSVVAIFADVPPLKYGTMTDVAVSDFPSLAGIMNMVLNDPNAYRYDTGPYSPMDPSPVMEVLVGTKDLDEADNRGPWGYFEKLVGKKVVLSQGTHDPYMPMPYFLESDRKLRSLGVHPLTIITLRQGHIGGAIVEENLINFLKALSMGESYDIPSGRMYMLQTDLVEHSSTGLSKLSVIGMPFTATVPWKLGVKEPGTLILCGEPGKPWAADLYDSGGRPKWSWSGVFDETESSFVDLPLPREVGIYKWFFTYDGTPIANTNTPVVDEHGNPVVCSTNVVEEQPLQQDVYYDYDRYNHLNFGIDQY
jgi:hypothetical protein